MLDVPVVALCNEIVYAIHAWNEHEEEIVNMAEIYPTDRASLERDCDLEFFIAGGPGGQHRNKVSTAVRLTHRPTGTVVTASERRSQYANREAAFARMAARLLAMQHVERPRKATRPTTASRVRRLQAKRRASMNKQLRSTPVSE